MLISNVFLFVIFTQWLKKQVEARRTSGFNDADLSPEENNPTWLYEKGE